MAFLPETVLLVGALLLFLLELFLERKRVLYVLGGIVALMAAVSLYFAPHPADTFYGLFTTYPTAKLFIYILTALALFSMYAYYEEKGSLYGEVSYLTLMASLGLSILVSSNNLGLTFLSLELSSITLYILTGTFRGDYPSKEGAYKYLVMGATGTSLFALGSAFYYGATGSLYLTNYTQENSFFTLATFLLLSALALKISAVPFHFWTPDAYESAPTPVTGFMATVPKLAVYFFLVKLLSYTSHVKIWMSVVVILSMLSMLYANFTAYAQNSVKRLLAYSSIAHAGYFLTGLTVKDPMLQKALLFYVIVYSFATLGAFTVLATLEKQENFSHHFLDYVGLGRKRPILAALLTLFLMALIGIPPMALFVGKLSLFMGLANVNLMWLALIFAVASVISAGYYLKVVVYMYMKEEGQKMHSFRLSAGESFVLTVCGLLVLLLGILPHLVYELL
ncbi:NADH-quinone oxidoreductase subunit N [Thermocrinis minervae]|uniref:NADH-quinone oxidoreductase subunit N n=1 Tax=Thermocrinis minervae TaxID=381751 RepID=A0A1M6PYV8_9AQUI|nr:NADH-quinone oxidoreductase subunit N [Thermocrinis minervae]SHK13046.1 NADH dehydrogenase subunit N [Thermocrinis minervae]